jgi:hypothetical protein
MRKVLRSPENAKTRPSAAREITAKLRKTEKEVKIANGY